MLIIVMNKEKVCVLTDLGEDNQIPQFRFLYSKGVCPVFCLKSLLKYWG